MTDMPRECPFCGAQPEITKHFKEEMWSLMHKCSKVGVIYMDWTTRKDRHIAAWNARAYSASELAKAYEAIVELANALKYYAPRVDDYRTDMGGIAESGLINNAAIIKTAREQGK